eukprot:TRINITY_DN7952_c1_g1_i3.p1 TRINITY_DN7952_c1_g1~~TRINITY_DN7952_c1_g1_i3.p1  ORF type:complete len:103 (+),score=15.31 TRINITY_DN7952_c1_g1_i3:336-644(+)
MLPYVQYAYNTSTHKQTKYSPFYLQFLRHPRLPMELYTSNASSDSDMEDLSSYAYQMQSMMREAHDIARENSDRAKQNAAPAFEVKQAHQLGDMVRMFLLPP